MNTKPDVLGEGRHIRATKAFAQKGIYGHLESHNDPKYQRTTDTWNDLLQQL